MKYPNLSGPRARSIAAGLAGLTIVTVAGAATAVAELPVVARWEMDESRRAAVMSDSGPHGLDGAIGDDVIVGGGRYEWGDVQPNSSPVNPERLVTVPHDARMNPELADYEIEFRYRTTENFGNVLQKGQNTTPGGYFKVEQPRGLVTCLFKDGGGTQKAVQALTATNDGDWHTILCQLDRDFGQNGALRIFIDGELDQINALTVPIGRVDNDWALSLGGKIQCNQDAVQCDYFEGEIDSLVLRRGQLSDPPPPASGGIFDGADASTSATRGVQTAID